ncbi:glycosyltransferase family A protein [Bacillus smithii]|uniref:Glycosyltransferase 2-like domain-containing protein n=1 Tax=Bacillus smithii 7_3_47FAA TaxID=665952 RepID=G9QJM4_9BACI|nr:glycosyltransferase family 2 protein [Bacillus smithii]EHL78622.1 hypothetical protein HMPREF1015_01907 [Bacillus smithii 7_3_47FAA]
MGKDSMSEINGLTIAICTRNRFNDLKRCVSSIARQNLVWDFPIELIIVDDGELLDKEINELKSILKKNINFVYYKKYNPGLFLSRIEVTSLANYNIILFLDDDVELFDINYLNKLLKTYMDYPECVGVGGIDGSMKISKRWSLYTRLICFNSGKPGKLSLSGYTGSMTTWLSMKDCFYTEFFHGCNMSFKSKSIKNIPLVEWLKSYSLGEDVFLSYIASKSGKLIINPKLIVNHFHSAASRDKASKVAYTEIVNHWHLLKFKDAKGIQYLCHFWTATGLLFISIFKHPYKTKGYLKGIFFILKQLIKFKFKIPKT